MNFDDEREEKLFLLKKERLSATRKNFLAEFIRILTDLGLKSAILNFSKMFSKSFFFNPPHPPKGNI